MNDIIFDLGIFIGVCATLMIEVVVVYLIRLLYHIFGEGDEDEKK